MKDKSKLTHNDLREFKVDRLQAIPLIKHYSCQYKGMEHYEQIGQSCAMSVNSTVNTIIGSAEYLEGYSLMPDEIHIERLADWFIDNKNYEIPRQALIFYMANFLKKKINEYYRTINKGGVIYSNAIVGNKTALREREKQFKIRKEGGVKILKC